MILKFFFNPPLNAAEEIQMNKAERAVKVQLALELLKKTSIPKVRRNPDLNAWVNTASQLLGLRGDSAADFENELEVAYIRS